MKIELIEKAIWRMKNRESMLADQIVAQRNKLTPNSSQIDRVKYNETIARRSELRFAIEDLETILSAIKPAKKYLAVLMVEGEIEDTVESDFIDAAFMRVFRTFDGDRTIRKAKIVISKQESEKVIQTMDIKKVVD